MMVFNNQNLERKPWKEESSGLTFLLLDLAMKEEKVTAEIVFLSFTTFTLPLNFASTVWIHHHLPGSKYQDVFCCTSLDFLVLYQQQPKENNSEPARGRIMRYMYMHIWDFEDMNVSMWWAEVSHRVSRRVTAIQPAQKYESMSSSLVFHRDTCSLCGIEWIAQVRLHSNDFSVDIREKKQQKQTLEKGQGQQGVTWKNDQCPRGRHQSCGIICFCT